VRVFAPIVLASVTATMTARALVGTHMMQHQSYRFVSTPEIAAYVMLGLLGGGMAVAYARGMDSSAAFFEGKFHNRVSQWFGSQTATTRCVMGGLVVGAVGMVMPRVMGSGQESLEAAMNGDLVWQILLAAAVLKVFTTAMTLGSGASGGTFFPALFIGAMSGGAFGELLDRAFPGATGGASSYALVGMAACVAGFTRGPLTAIVIVFEITNDYTAILPLMVACTTASALCHAVLGGMHSPGSLLAAIPERPVKDCMSAAEEPLDGRAGFVELRERLLRSAHGVVPLVDDAGRLSGIALLRDIQELLREETLGELIRAQDVARGVRSVPEDLDLRSARDQLEDWELPAAPVVSRTDPNRVLGMIALSDIRAAARAEMAKLQANAGEH